MSDSSNMTIRLSMDDRRICNYSKPSCGLSRRDRKHGACLAFLLHALEAVSCHISRFGLGGGKISGELVLQRFGWRYV